MASKTFYIIDGHAQIYRAYFAPFRDLTSPDGQPVKATFVFTQMLLNLVQQKKPDYLAMVIDVGGDQDVFRAEIYPKYKANRPPRPADFTPQEERIIQIVRDTGIPIFSKPGFEADDVMATMARRLEGKGWDVVLVSKDKDLRQLLDDHTTMYDVATNKFYGPADMQADKGYGPSQAIEVQTLMGDATDNVPGVPGVGEKTAAKLINQYGNVAGVVAHADELTPKLKQSVKESADLLEISRKLVTLKTDVEMEFDPEACRFTSMDTPEFRRHLTDLGFRNLLAKVTGEAATPAPRAVQKVQAEPIGLFNQSLPAEESVEVNDAPPAAPAAETSKDCDYRLVNTPETFATFLRELKQQKAFAFDTETDALGAMASNIVGFSFSWKAGTGFYVAVGGPLGAEHLELKEVLTDLRPVLEDPAVGKIGHNIKYDLLATWKAGVKIAGVRMDTMVAAFVLDASRMQYGIDRLALDLLGFAKIPTVALIGKGKNEQSMRDVPLAEICRYASEDADIAWRLYELLAPRLAAIPELAELNDTLEVPLLAVLTEMEHNGIAVDGTVLREQSEVLAVRIDDLRARIMKEAGEPFNPDSPKQLGDILFNRLKLRVIKKTKTGPSTDVEVLDKLALDHPVPKLVLEYRSLVKLKNTYLDSLTDYINPATGRIHAHFNPTGAATGRLSCSDPNLQNIPIRTDEGRRIRLAFVAGNPENVLLTADYSQIELRVLAHFTEEPALLRAFANEEDIHKAVAAEVFGVPLADVSRAQRDQAKVVNFGIIYGISAFGLSRRIEGLSQSGAAELIAAYNRRFPAIESFMEACVDQAKRLGYVSTILGRRRPLPDINASSAPVRNASERMAINSVVQGSAADLIKKAMLAVQGRIDSEGRPSRMLLQVHDELVFETPAAAAAAEAEMVRREMTGAMQLKVPLRVEVGYGRNWQELK